VPLGAFLRSDDLVLRDRNGDHAVIDARKIRMVGSHNRENAMAAVVAAKIMGGNPDNFVHTLTRFPGVPHRMEWVASANGVDFINNSMCTNPEAFARSIEACGRPVVLIAGGRNKGLSFDGSRDVMARWCRAVVTIGEHGPVLAQLARQADVPTVVEAGELEPAVAVAVDAAKPGDVVLLAPGCASMDQFKDFMERGERFKDAVRNLAEGAGK
jgi:UDP-N-acetylmuramoylalanine--D-glutamate ligase